MCHATNGSVSGSPWGRPRMTAGSCWRWGTTFWTPGPPCPTSPSGLPTTSSPPTAVQGDPPPNHCSLRAREGLESLMPGGAVMLSMCDMCVHFRRGELKSVFFFVFFFFFVDFGKFSDFLSFFFALVACELISNRKQIHIFCLKSFLASFCHFF